MASVTEYRSLLEPRAPEIDSETRTEEHPYRASLWVMLTGYTLMTLLLLGIGYLLTHPLDSTVGRWDQNVS